MILRLRPKKKVFVSDIPTDPKNFRRLNEILFKFSEKKFIWLNFGCDETRRDETRFGETRIDETIQNGGVRATTKPARTYFVRFPDLSSTIRMNLHVLSEKDGFYRDILREYRSVFDGTHF